MRSKIHLPIFSDNVRKAKKEVQRMKTEERVRAKKLARMQGEKNCSPSEQLINTKHTLYLLLWANMKKKYVKRIELN